MRCLTCASDRFRFSSLRYRDCETVRHKTAKFRPEGLNYQPWRDHVSHTDCVPVCIPLLWLPSFRFCRAARSLPSVFVVPSVFRAPAPLTRRPASRRLIPAPVGRHVSRAGVGDQTMVFMVCASDLRAWPEAQHVLEAVVRSTLAFGRFRRGYGHLDLLARCWVLLRVRLRRLLGWQPL